MAQLPHLQVSFRVQVSPSSQFTVFTAWTQPLAMLQLSVVHGLLSSQLDCTQGAQVPATQASSTVQTLPSVQAALLAVTVQPVAMSQASSVQGLPSSQLTPLPALHVPSAQTSPTVQTLPSSHGAVLFLWTQPPLASHASVVQTRL